MCWGGGGTRKPQINLHTFLVATILKTFYIILAVLKLSDTLVLCQGDSNPAAACFPFLVSWGLRKARARHTLLSEPLPTL